MFSPAARRRRFSALVLAAAALAGAASAQPGGPVVDPNDPIAIEQRNAAMEDAFADQAEMFNPEGMMSGEGMFGAFLGPSVTKADFARFARLLELSKPQAEAAETIYRQRIENYEVKGKPVKELITSIMKKAMQAMSKGEQFEPENMDELAKAVLEIQRERASMTKGVMEDLKGLLTKEQEPAWPKVEAAERRNRLLRFQPVQMTQGVQVDFRDILDALFSAPGAAKPDGALQGALDQALAAYESALDEQAKLAIPMDDAFRSDMIVSKPTPEQAERQMKIMTEGMAIGGRVLAATDTASKALAAALASTPDLRDRFLLAFNTAAYPQIYRPTHGENVLAAALKLTDLSDDQRAKLDAIKAEIEPKFKDLRPKAVEELVGMNRFQAEYMAAKDDEARTKASEKVQVLMSTHARSDLKQLDKDVVKRVRALMTDSQREKLPKRPRMMAPFEPPAPGDAPEAGR